MTSVLTTTDPLLADWPQLPIAVPQTMAAVTFRKFGPGSPYADEPVKLRSPGFEHLLDGVEPRFVNEVRSIFGPGGAHVIVDNVESPMVWEHGMRVLAR